MKNIFRVLLKRKFFNLIKYNKQLQKVLGLSIQDYELLGEIEIEIIPILSLSNDFHNFKFINLDNYNNENYKIYFDGKEVKRNYINYKDNIIKINVIIIPENKSLKGLFNSCQCIKNINFIKFNRTDIIDMSEMFYNCRELIKIEFTEFNSSNVINMKSMFSWCSSLKYLYFYNFNTSNVINMSYMFYKCESLEILNVSNFDTRKTTNMNNMFNFCSSLQKLNLLNFNTTNITDMSEMFCGCSSLIK